MLLRSKGDPTSFKFTLKPEILFKHDHVDFEQLVGLAEGNLDPINREILEIHLSGCDDCREDVRSFLAFRNEMEPELLIRYGPAAPKPQHEVKRLESRSRLFSWKPAYAAGFIVILGIGIIVAVIIRSRRAANLEASHPTIQNKNLAISPTKTPSESVVLQESFSCLVRCRPTQRQRRLLISRHEYRRTVNPIHQSKSATRWR